jgi:photosystem II stability/assembly factor-like uncharacterized protein
LLERSINVMNTFKKFLLSISIVIVLACSFLSSTVSAQSTVGSWTHLGLNNLTVASLVSDPTNASILYAGTSDGIYKSTDGGNTWTATSNQGNAALIVVIAPNNPNILYATLGNTGVQKSIDGGTNWTNITNNFGTPTIILDLAVDPNDSNTVIAAPYGNCLGIRKTTDGGVTWNAVGGGCDIYRIVYDPVNQNTVYAGGTNFSGYFEKSTDGGNTWNAFSQGLDSPGAVHGIAIDAHNPNVIYVGDENNGVYKTTNGGANWSLLSNSPSVPIVNDLAVNQLDSSVYAKSSTAVSQSTDGGDNWTAINSGSVPTGIEKLIILPNDPYNLYAATDTGVYVYGLQPSPTMRQLSALSPAKVWIGLKNSDDVGIKFDLLAQVYKDDTLVTSGELDSVAAGSSGFNNAKLDAISFNAFSPIAFPSGSQLKIRLSVRNACSGSGHNSGTARLWYNDTQANSQFGATIGTNIGTYYLLDNFFLGTTTGSAKTTIDIAAGAKCSAFNSFGTWSITP